MKRVGAELQVSASGNALCIRMRHGVAVRGGGLSSAEAGREFRETLA
jgi:hypothetical protein